MAQTFLDMGKDLIKEQLKKNKQKQDTPEAGTPETTAGHGAIPLQSVGAEGEPAAYEATGNGAFGKATLRVNGDKSSVTMLVDRDHNGTTETSVTAQGDGASATLTIKNLEKPDVAPVTKIDDMANALKAYGLAAAKNGFIGNLEFDAATAEALVASAPPTPVPAAAPAAPAKSGGRKH